MIENAIVITGAGQRIGLFLAKHFLQAGAPVVFTYRTRRPAVDALIEAGAWGIQADFCHPSAIHHVGMQLPKKVRSVRALIHNASLWMDDAALEQNPRGLMEMAQVHMQAPYDITLACEPLLKACEQTADVIAISDMKTANGHADYAAYLATKAGLESMMVSFAKRFAPFAKVNVIAPGLVIFNPQDTEEYKQARLQENAIPVEPGEQVILDAVQLLMKNPNSTGQRIALGG